MNIQQKILTLKVKFTLALSIFRVWLKQTILIKNK